MAELAKVGSVLARYAELRAVYADYMSAELVDPVALAEVEYVLQRVDGLVAEWDLTTGPEDEARLLTEAGRLLDRAAHLLGVKGDGDAPAR
jgi:hypothetical protein